MAFVELKNVQKVYKTGEVETKALVGVDFEVEKGELCVVVGPSGAGKSTVLNLLGGMDSPTSGDIVVDGKHIEHLNDKQLTLYRRNDIGFIFQFYNLVQNLTALENVELATEICKDHFDPAKTLEQVGLQDRMNHFPAQMSGGAARCHCAGAGQKPQAAALRRANRRAGFQHRPADFGAFAENLPRNGDDGDHHHAQQQHHPYGRPRDSHQKRAGDRAAQK